MHGYYYEYIEKSKIYVIVNVKYMSRGRWKFHNILFKRIVSLLLPGFVGFKANLKSKSQNIKSINMC